MDELTRRLDRLGDVVAEVGDRTAPAGALAQARRHLLAPAPPRSRHRRPRALYGLAAAALVAAVLAVVFVSRHRPMTSFEVGAPPVAGAVGDWVAADEQPVPLQFSDGSAFELSPGTRLRVAETAADGAALVIEKGSVHATIRHLGPDTRWTLRAGPFTLQVIGTSFDVSWVPGSETLQLLVKDGAVAVSGPLLPANRKVAAGERLIVSVGQGRMDLSAADSLATTPLTSSPSAGSPSDGPNAAAAPAPCVAPAPEDAEAPGPGSGGGSTAAGSEGDAGPTSSSAWQALAAKRKYRDAMTEVERLGFERELSRSSAAGLKALADTARFAGQPARAQQALLSLRKRFGAGGTSAFLLGRIAADQLSSSGEAVRWFETYLREAPKGPLAEQALGRILDIQRHGSPEAAKQAAQRYLARYPNGAYAALARSVLTP